MHDRQQARRSLIYNNPLTVHIHFSRMSGGHSAGGGEQPAAPQEHLVVRKTPGSLIHSFTNSTWHAYVTYYYNTKNHPPPPQKKRNETGTWPSTPSTSSPPGATTR